MKRFLASTAPSAAAMPVIAVSQGWDVGDGEGVSIRRVFSVQYSVFSFGDSESVASSQ